MAWIEEIIENAKKKVSVAHFVRTNEFTRPFQLLRSLSSTSATFLLYDAWNGLRRIQFEDNDWTEIAIKDEFKKNLIDPIEAMHYIIKELQEHNTVAVFQHFDTVNIKVNGIPDLNDALRYLIQFYDLNPLRFKSSILVLFLHDTSAIAKDVLDHTLLYEVSGCTAEERETIINKALTGRKAKEKWVPTKPKIAALVESGAGLTKIQFNTALVMAFATKKLTPQYISSAKRLILEASGIGKIITPDRALDPKKIGGYKDIKNIISLIAKKVTEKKRAEKLGCASVRGILLFGPPGTGKTLLCEAFAKIANKPVISVSAGDVFSKWYGESARAIKKIIELGEETEAVIFIDEIEAVVGSRGSGNMGQHEETARTLGELLRYMGDYKRKAIIIGTTNRPDLLDFAMRRAGRFDKIIYVPLPDKKARMSIFKVHIENPIDHAPLNTNTVDYKLLAKESDHFSGAEISQVVKDAADFAFEDNSETVTMEHFEEALKINKPNTENRKTVIGIFNAYAKDFCRGIRTDEVDIEINEESTYTKEDLGRLV